MRRGILFVLAVLPLAWPGVAGAQTDIQFRQCNGADPVLAILGCTAIIDSRDTMMPLRSRALVNRGLAYVMRGQNDRAIADLDRAVMLDSTNSVALVARGNFYQAQGSRERALADYNQAINADAKNASGFAQRG